MREGPMSTWHHLASYVVNNDLTEVYICHRIQGNCVPLMRLSRYFESLEWTQSESHCPERRA